MNVAAQYAGMSLATGDGLRKALSKKRPVTALAAYAEEFFTGAATRGRNPETSKKVWEMIMSFAGYSFCKGHSCSYIQVSPSTPVTCGPIIRLNFSRRYSPMAADLSPIRLHRRGYAKWNPDSPPDINASDFRCIGRKESGLVFNSSGGCQRMELGGSWRREAYPPIEGGISVHWRPEKASWSFPR